MIRPLSHVALIALLLVGVASLFAGCPRMPEPDGCTPRDHRCSPEGVPQVCSPGQRWTPADRRCGDIGAVCCLTASAYGGAPLHACVPATACLAPDGGLR